MKNTIYKVISIAVLTLAVIGLSRFGSTDKDNIASPDPRSATYTLEDEKVTLVKGVSEKEAAPGSASKIVTRYFGNEVSIDLNEDGREDKVFLMTQEAGGSGTFFYAVAALNTPEGYIGSQGLFLGDRIAPQTTEISRNPSHKNVVVVNYAERKAGEPMTARPSIGKSIWLKFDPETMQFGEVVQNFEGEADPSKMSLGMKTWEWVSTIYNNDTTISPARGKTFTLTFKSDGTFSATTDCNRVGGRFYGAGPGGKISFGEMFSTKMYCEKSQEADFQKMLSDSTSYHFTSKGELIFDLKYDSGVFIFR